VQQWLSFAANEMWHGPSKARAVFRFDRDWDLEQVQGDSHWVLRILDDHLKDRDWLECGRPTIADLAVFPYTGLVHEGKVDVAGYPRVVAWLARIKSLPGYVSIEGLE